MFVIIPKYLNKIFFIYKEEHKHLLIQVKRKTLNQARTETLNDIIYDTGIRAVYDRKICPDCIQY